VKICLSVTNDVVTDQRVYKIAHSLTKFTTDITVIGRKRRKSFPIDKKGIYIKRFLLLFNKGPLFYVEYNIRLFFFLLCNNFDILVANDLDTLPANYLAARCKKVKLVYDSHEYFTEVPELVQRSFIRKTWERIEKWILPNINYSYTVCNSIAGIYNKKYGINMQTIRNFPYCFDYSEKDLKINHSQEKMILYQGSVNKGRGLELVIQSIKYIENAKFHIVGDGDIIEQLKQFVTEYKLENKVVFAGRLPINELSEYTKRADLGISLEEKLGLNYYYALPNKLFDYIKAGVPVLVSDFPEMGLLVKKYDIGITTLSTNPKEIAKIIKFMVTDSQSIQKWQKNLQKAASELCWEKEEIKLLNLYEQIISPL